MMPEQVQRYRRQLTAQQRQDNCDRSRIELQHPSDLLRSLTHGQDRRRTARRRLDHALNFTISTFHVLGVRHMMRMCIPSSTCMCVEVCGRCVYLYVCLSHRYTSKALKAYLVYGNINLHSNQFNLI